MRRASLAAFAAALSLGAAAPARAQDGLQQATAALQAAYLRAVEPGETARRQADLLATVMQRVAQRLVTEPDLSAFSAAALGVLDPLPEGRGVPDQVFTEAVNAGLRVLDPLARYIPPAPADDETAAGSPEGSFVGVGISLEAAEGAARVLEPLPDTPAERAGLQPGDLIVQVDGQPTPGLPEALRRLRGPAGSAVALTLRRAGRDADWTVALTRETIVRPLVRWRLEDDILVLRLSSFSGPVSARLLRAVAEAGASQVPRGIVLDLRGNGGGLLREAIRTADAFLPGGEIASMRGRAAAPERVWTADAAQLLPDVPMAVLVDRGSASASELVAAALQDNRRAVVLGQRSYGKGTVQTTFPLGEERGSLKLTTAHYLGPASRPVQDIGVLPDVELVLPARPEAAPRPRPADAAPPAASLPDALCPALAPGVRDPGLACALAWLRAGGTDGLKAALAVE